jgi:aminoglycoside phosphotransferase (APT) family kinase protein
MAARCALADGRRVFIKAVGTAQNPHSPDFYRREGRVAASLPALVPAPRLLDIVDDGDWVALVFEEVDGHPPKQPWSLDDLDATFAALRQLAQQTTPTPLPDLPTFADHHRTAFSGFRQLAAGALAPDDWTAARLDTLVALESEWEDAAAGDTLLHADMRADNLLVRADGSVVIVDWPFACRGAAWVDIACMLPSVGLDGGPSPIEVEEHLDPLAGVDADALNRVLVGLCGYFTFQAMQPDPPGLHTLRAFQRAQGEVMRPWLDHRLGF